MDALAVHASQARICRDFSSQTRRLPCTVIFITSCCFFSQHTILHDCQFLLGIGEDGVAGEVGGTLCGRSFFGASQAASEPETLSFQQQIESPKAPALTVGLQSILAFSLLLHNTQAHAHFLWGSFCKCHLTFCF